MSAPVVLSDPEVASSEPLIPRDVYSAGGSADAAAAAERLQEYWRQAARWLYFTAAHLATNGLFGLVTGICLRSIGQTIAMAVVLLFVAFQILAYYGYVNVNWNQLGSSIGRTMDLTTASGRLDVKRVQTTVWGLITKIASYGILSVLGFSLGFVIGWSLIRV